MSHRMLRTFGLKILAGVLAAMLLATTVFAGIATSPLGLKETTVFAGLGSCPLGCESGVRPTSPR